jgi:hypothetical protein
LFRRGCEVEMNLGRREERRGSKEKGEGGGGGEGNKWGIGE